MLYLYDKAFEKKLKKVFPRVVYASVDAFYDRYYLENNNTMSIELPAISLWRLSHEFNPNNARSNMNTPSAYTFKRPNLSESQVRQIYTMQIPLNYQIDLWASSDIDRDDLFTELMYFLTLYPNVTIEYEGNQYSFPIHIEPADDVTDIANFTSVGNLYRMSIPCKIPDARLFFYKDVNCARYINISISGDGIPDQNFDVK